MNIPEEVLIQILLRLPVKCLLKFLCVCKAWCALVRSPRFIDLHLNHDHLPQTDYLLLKRCETTHGNTDHVLSFYSHSPQPQDDDDGGSGSLRVAGPDFPAFDHCTELVGGPCNGIVCIAATYVYKYRSFDRHYFKDNIYLCNPATRECRRLPDRPFGTPPPEIDKERRRPTFILSRDGLGFGFDPCNNEYKVVSIMFWRSTSTDHPHNFYATFGIYQIEIYDLSSNCWRVAENISVDASLIEDNYEESDYYDDLGWYGRPISFVSKCGLFFNGRLHWTAWTGEDDIATAKKIIMCFDMSKEVVGEIPYAPYPGPNDEYYWPTNESLVVLDDSLAWIVVITPDEQTRIDVWLMMEYGVKESWMKRHSLLAPFTGIPYPVSFWNNHTLLLQTSHGELASWDLLREHSHLKKHNIYTVTNRLAGSPRAIIIHKESLVSLK